MKTHKSPSDNNVNISAVTRELLDLIMKIPEAERKELLTKLKPGPSEPPAPGKAENVTTELIDVIMKSNMQQRCDLLGELKALSGQSKRSHSRTPYFTEIHYILNDQLFFGHIKNISRSGVFIEISKSDTAKLSVGKLISMNFPHPETGKHIKVSGEIARIVKSGFGVRFETLLDL